MNNLVEIADLETYDTSKISLAQLRDDMRLVLAHYSTLKSGKVLHYNRGGERIEATEKLLSDLLHDIMKELIKRGSTTFHPNKMKDASRELFDKVVNRLKREGIDVPIDESISLKTYERILTRLVPFVIVDQAISLVGSVTVDRVLNPRDIDVLIRWDKLEPAITRNLEAVLAERDIHYILDTRGPHSTYIPIYDFVFVPMGFNYPGQSHIIDGEEYIRNIYPFIITPAYLSIEDDDEALIIACNDEIPKLSVPLKIKKLFPEVEVRDDWGREPTDLELGHLYAVPRPVISKVEVNEPYFEPFKVFKTIDLDESALREVKIDFLGTGGLTTTEQGKRKNSTIAITAKDETILVGVFKDFPKEDVPKVEAFFPTSSKSIARAEELDGNTPIIFGKSWQGNHIRVRPFEVFHTKVEENYGYIIEAERKKIAVVPEFLSFNFKLIKRADIAILDGASVGRDILFSGGSGGHMDVLKSYKRALKAGVGRIAYVHIGLNTEKFLTRLKKDKLNSDELELASLVSKGVVVFPNDKQTIKEVSILESIKPKQRFKTQKPHMGTWTDFFSVDEIWDKWAKQKLEQGKEIVASTKWDGMRVVISNGSEPSIWFEDSGNERANHPFFKKLSAAIAKLPSCVLDGEFLVRKGQHILPRTQIFTAIAGDIDAEPIIEVFDLLYWDGEDYSERPYKERLAKLKSVKLPAQLNKVEHYNVTDKASLERLGKKLAAVPGSEGIMLAVLDEPYHFGGTDALAKVHTVFEVKGIVLSVNRTQNGYTYTIGLAEPPEGYPEKKLTDFKGKKYASLGNTFVSKEKLANEGDTLNVVVEEIIKLSDGSVAWGKPTPAAVDRSRGPFAVKQVLDMAKRAHVLKEEIEEASRPPNEAEEEGITRSESSRKYWESEWQRVLSGLKNKKFILHEHWRGLKEEETKLSREQLYKTSNSVHWDLRLGAKTGWWGITLFAGRASDAKQKLEKLARGNVYVQSWPKPKALSKAHEGWLDYAKDSPKVHGPGEVGSTSQMWSVFFAIDSGTYSVGVANRSFVELFINGKLLKGRYLWQKADVGDRRIWILQKPEDQTPYAESHDFEQTVNRLRKRGHKYIIWPDEEGVPRLHEI
jgi:hypothetical protein